MAKKGTLTVRIVADTKAAEQGLDRFATKAQTTGQKLQDAGKKMTAFATVPVAAAMGLATKAASDLQQAVGGTEAVFGEASDAIDSYADKAASASGLSEREFREATTSIGGQLKRMTGDVDLAAEQSIKLTGVAADLAATYGGTTAEAVQALGAAFRGEADPAERFNLNLKIGAVNAKAVEMGLAATTSEVDENAKAQATLALIMEQSADAQGQFSREAGSAAGSMQIARAELENAAAEIGANLLPLAADLAGGVADVARAFGELPVPVQQSVLALGGVLALAGPVAGGIGTIMTAAGKAKEGATALSGAFETLQLKAMYLKQGLGGAAGLAASLGAVGAIIATGTVLYQQYADEKAEAARVTDRLVDAMKAENAELETNRALADELALKDYASDIREAEVSFGVLTAAVRNHGDALESLDDATLAVAAGHKSIEDALSDAGIAGTALGDALLKLYNEMGGAQFRDLIDDLDGLSDQYDTATEQTRNQEGAARDVAAATDDAGEAAEDAAPKVQDYSSAVTDSIQPHKDLEDAIKGVNSAIAAQFDPLRGMRDALFENQDAQRAVTEAERDAKRAQDDLNGAVWLYGDKSPEATEAAWRLEEAQRRVDEANRAAGDSAMDVTAAANELAGQMRAGNVDIAAAEAQIRQWAEQGLITEDQARQMKDELKLAAVAAGELDSQDVSVQVTADTSRFWQSIQDLYSGAAGVPIGMGDVGGPIVLPQEPKRHTGGPTQRNRAYIVGGPGAEELLITGNQPGQIMSPAATQNALGGAGSQIIVQSGAFQFNYATAPSASESAVVAGRKLRYTLGV